MVQKWPFFQLFFLGTIGQKKVFYHILQRKNAFLGYKNKKFKSRKIDIFPKGLTRSLSNGASLMGSWVNPWFWSKNGHFSSFFFLGNIGQENVFYDILERKIAFLGYKNKKFIKSKNWHFSKGVKPWFRSKMSIFPPFFF